MTIHPPRSAAIIGAGPSGLMAAEILGQAGVVVRVFDRMASPARKFLMAGRGGLNLTHSEPRDLFLTRYAGTTAGLVSAAIRTFPPADLIRWCESLNVPCFTGSSGRIFPSSFKASPLLRAWLRRLGSLGVEIKTGQNFEGFDRHGRPLINGEPVMSDCVLLALGGASWPRLGSDGRWVPLLMAAGVDVAPLTASNCGVRIGWSAHIARHEGEPLKRIAMRVGSRPWRKGEAIITTDGLEGGVIYALAQAIRADLAAKGTAQITIDLRPDLSEDTLAQRLEAGRKGQSIANLLRKSAGLAPQAAAVLREQPLPPSARLLAQAIKSLPLQVTGLEGLSRAISTAGGITQDALTGQFMLKAHPGLFAAGEMLDVDAPTGGYLLQAAFATGVAAARGMLAWMEAKASGGDVAL